MTQLAFILDGKKKARIFSDTKARNGRGVTVSNHHYKVDHLTESGLAVTGRGRVITSDYAFQHAKEMELCGFDDYLSHWPSILEKAIRSTLIYTINRNENPSTNSRMFSGFFQKAPWDKVTELLKKCSVAKNATGMPSNMTWTEFEHELYVVGFSEKHKTMGLAVCTSIDNFHIHELYEKDRPLFLHTDKVATHFKGRVPKSDKHMVTGMRVSHLHDVQNGRDQPLTPKTKIKKTTVYADGRFAVKTMGPFFKKNGKL